MSVKVVVALGALVMQAGAVSAVAAPAATTGCRVPDGPTAVLVEMVYSNGWGTSERLVIFRSGRVWTSWPPMFPGGYTPRLPCSKIAPVYDALERARFATLRREYVPDGWPFPDAPSASITYLGRTVTVGPDIRYPGVDAPQRFVRAFELVSRVFSAYHP